MSRLLSTDRSLGEVLSNAAHRLAEAEHTSPAAQSERLLAMTPAEVDEQLTDADVFVPAQEKLEESPVKGAAEDFSGD